MIRAWKSASWPIRSVMLVCLYVIIDSVSSLGWLWFSPSKQGDTLDRFTAVRLDRQAGKAAVVYSYLHASSTAQMTAVYVADSDLPTVGSVRYGDPGGMQVLLSDLAPADLPLRWSPAGKLSLTLPAGILREADWNQRRTCLVKDRTTRRVCWNAEYVDVN